MKLTMYIKIHSQKCNFVILCYTYVVLCTYAPMHEHVKSHYNCGHFVIVVLHTGTCNSFCAAYFQIFLDNDVAVDERNYDKQTPLHLACIGGHHEYVLYIIQAHITEDNHCNHHNACIMHGYTYFCHLYFRTAAELLKKGARTGIKDDDGKTPLHCATSNGHFETVKLLINNQADIDSA